MIEEVLPPYYSDQTLRDRIKIFLAGTIDMGNSADWQRKFIDDNKDLDAIVYNPRRKDWNSSWEQSIDNPEFNKQVTWELEHLEESDIIIFHFEPESDSMITLLEFGKFSGYPNKHVLMHCPKGYKRKGNVDIFSKRYNVTMFDNIEDIYPIVRYISHQKLRKS